MFNPHDAVWAVGGVEYHGFLDVVRRNIAPEILKPNQNGKASFPEWWAQHVDGHLIAAIGLLKTEYNNLMVRDFVPRLQDQAYNEYHGRKFALGAKNSMLDEVNIDLDYIESTFRAGRPANRPEVAQFAKLRSDVQHRFQVALSFLGTAAELRNAVRVADIELTGKDSGNSAKVRYQADVEAKTAYRSYRLMLMREIVALNEAAALPGGASTPTIDQVRKSASTTLMDIIDEMDSYYGIMSTIEL
jgi:hypothetical protein